MRLPPQGPQKPHFFKFIRPGLKHCVSIPKSFTKYLKEKKCGHALLRRGRHKWLVKIGDGWVFGDGWENFVKENGVEEFDFVVFKHEGNMVFEIMVFDPSTCERQYPEVEPKSFKHLNTIHGSKKKVKGKAVIVSRSKPKITYSKCSPHPYFSSIFTLYNIKSSSLYIPLKFARLNGLSNRRCEMIVRDKNQRAYPAKLGWQKTHVCLTGWRNLQIENGFKVGDAYKLELTQQGENPIMNLQLMEQGEIPILKFHYRRNANKPVMTHINAETTDSNSALDKYPNFVATLRPCSMKNQFLNLSKKFSRTNGISNGEMILVDENQRSWTVETRDIGKYVYIREGWSDFCFANGLKEGDVFKFELIENGKKPIVNFSCMKKS